MTAIGADDLPLLDEPLPVELANTWYASGDTVVDFLGTPALVSLWFETASVASDLVLPAPVTEADAAAIRGLRDAVRALVAALAAGAPPPADAIDAVNRCAARSPSGPRLVCSPDGELRTERVHAGTARDVLLGRVAARTIDFVVGGAVSRLERCAGPGCGMLYVREHHRRRWCHESCGHRARQARYYRRKTRHVTGDPS